jgi:peptidoglycan glycosyltransferase
MAIVAAAIANQGLVMAPYLVGDVFDADGTEVELIEPNPIIQAISVDTAAVITQLMERVVTEGTGRLAAIPGVRVAGKTGTATGTADRPHAWFIGFAPVEQPSIAIAVFVENGGEAAETATGGAVAAPIAARVLNDWLSR